MNGRVYDPELGRFLSADPLIQAPYNSQGYNRYSYVFNNPLSFTDPSGYKTQADCEDNGQAGCTEVEEVTVSCSYCAELARGMQNYRQFEAFYQNNVSYLSGASNQQTTADPYGQLPAQIWGAPHYAQGQHLLNREAQKTQATVVLGGVTFLISGEALVVAKLVELANKSKNTQQLVNALNNSTFFQKYINGTGGRWGANATRQLNHREATKLENNGWTVINGAGRKSEEWIPGPGGGTKGGTWVDITAQSPSGQILRVQTVDTLSNGQPTLREAAAMARIQAAFPLDLLQWVPK